MGKSCLICRSESKASIPKNESGSSSSSQKCMKRKDQDDEGFKLYEELVQVLDPNRPNRLPETDFLGQELQYICPVCVKPVESLWKYHQQIQNINSKMDHLIQSIKSAIRLQSNSPFKNYDDEQDQEQVEDFFAVVKEEPITFEYPEDFEDEGMGIILPNETSPTKSSNTHELRQRQHGLGEQEVKEDANEEPNTFEDQIDDDPDFSVESNGSDNGSESSEDSDPDYSEPTSSLSKDRELKRSKNSAANHNCRYCELKFSSKSHLLNHCKRDHRSSDGSLPRGRPKKRSNSDITFDCKICHRNFRTETYLISHNRRIHEGIKPHKCPESGCDMSFFERKDLVRHQRVHSGEKPFSCQTCGNKFTRRDCLLEHRRRVCGIDENFANLVATLGPELAEKRRRNLEIRRSKAKDQEEEPESLLCELCGGNFSSKILLENHTKKIHEGELPFKCPKCPNRFLSKANLNRHLLTHDKLEAAPPFSLESSALFSHFCEVCGISFKTKQSLMYHSHRIHQGPPLTHECSTCSKRFQTTRDLTRHERVHSGEKPFSCQNCGRFFSRKDYVLEHQRKTESCRAKLASQIDASGPKSK